MHQTTNRMRTFLSLSLFPLSIQHKKRNLTHLLFQRERTSKIIHHRSRGHVFNTEPFQTVQMPSSFSFSEKEREQSLDRHRQLCSTIPTRSPTKRIYSSQKLSLLLETDTHHEQRFTLQEKKNTHKNTKSMQTTNDRNARTRHFTRCGEIFVFDHCSYLQHRYSDRDRAQYQRDKSGL